MPQDNIHKNGERHESKTSKIGRFFDRLKDKMFGKKQCVDTGDAEHKAKENKDKSQSSSSLDQESVNQAALNKFVN